MPVRAILSETEFHWPVLSTGEGTGTTDELGQSSKSEITISWTRGSNRDEERQLDSGYFGDGINRTC